MSRVITAAGVGISRYTGNRFFDVEVTSRASLPAGDHTPTPDRAIESTTTLDYMSKFFIRWGDDNQLPLQMIADIESCGILNSIIDNQARFAIGKGVMWAWCKRDNGGDLQVEEICDEQMILDFMEENNHYANEFGWMKDQIGMHNGVVRFMLDKERKNIAAFQRDDITELRYATMNLDGDRKGKIDFIYLCAQWDKVASTEDPRVLKIRLLDENRPFQHLKELVDTTNEVEFALTFRGPAWNKKYYPLPLWYSSRNWVKIAQQIPAMKKAMFEHNFRPRYHVIIYPSFWERHYEVDENGKSWNDYTNKERDEKRQLVYDKIDEHLAGPDNHGKAIFTDGWVDQQSGKVYSEIEIKPIDDTIKQGDMLPDSANANSEIAFATRFNPAIIGASLPSGPYTNAQGGSNVREAATMQIIMMEPERQNVYRIYNLIKKFNGWDKAFTKPGLTLEPIIPATILTTLDTGGGTAPVMSGAKPGSQPNNNKPQPPNE
jgi:hypothetical protein